MDRVRVQVCVGTNCCFAGGESLIETLEADIDLIDFIEIEGVRCMDKTCAGGRESPVVQVGGKRITRATPESVIEEIEKAVLAKIAGLPKAGETGDA